MGNRKVLPLLEPIELKAKIQAWGRELGFEKLGVSDIDLKLDEARFGAWLSKGFGADMAYLDKHGTKRFRPDELVSGSCSVICARLNYLPTDVQTVRVLRNPNKAYISRYALGRDYHKVMRKKLQKLADRIAQCIGPFGYRVFSDSAPVLEKALARKAGLGWVGKHSLILDRAAGSWFFLGEIYTDLLLPVDEPVEPACGNCQACMKVCPTQAIVAPYELDARRCISYLTIENKGSIPQALRPLIGNRVFGCDDCQLMCPWNKYAQRSELSDFTPRHELDECDLLALLAWRETEYLEYTRGSALRRVGYWGWVRNLSVAVGNAPKSVALVDKLREKLAEESLPEWLREHLDWAIKQQTCHHKKPKEVSQNKVYKLRS